MNLNLPTYFKNDFLFSCEGQMNFIIFGLFLIALLFISYSIIVLSKKESGVGFKKINLNLFKSKKSQDVSSTDLGGEVYQDALRILDQARADSLKILGRAQAKAQGILDTSYVISQENKRRLEDNIAGIYDKQGKALDNLSEELLALYKEAVQEGKQENIRTLYEVTEAMKRDALSEVDDFKNVIKKGTIEAQEALEQKIMTEYSKADTEIEEYKDKKIKSLNNKILDVLSNIYTEVIGQDFDQIKHEKLILKMLKEEMDRLGVKSNS